jgi:hypothetical protein
MAADFLSMALSRLIRDCVRWRRFHADCFDVDQSPTQVAVIKMIALSEELGACGPRNPV